MRGGAAEADRDIRGAVVLERASRQRRHHVSGRAHMVLMQDAARACQRAHPLLRLFVNIAYACFPSITLIVTVTGPSAIHPHFKFTCLLSYFALCGFQVETRGLFIPCPSVSVAS